MPAAPTRMSISPEPEAGKTGSGRSALTNISGAPNSRISITRMTNLQRLGGFVGACTHF